MRNTANLSVSKQIFTAFKRKKATFILIGNYSNTKYSDKIHATDKTVCVCVPEPRANNYSYILLITVL
jgi:hypothetical protein